MPASTTRSFPAAQPGEQHVFSTSAKTVAAVDRLVDQLKAQQVYEQSNGQAVWSLGAAFWELRFPKG
jgi:hypothetical protein